MSRHYRSIKSNPVSLLRRLIGTPVRALGSTIQGHFEASVGRSRAGANSRKPMPGIELLDDRLVLSTTMAGGMTQGNLYGDQSVVVALPIAMKNEPTQIQVMDTGDIGMGQQSVRTFVPFANYRGPLSLAVGDFLHKGYQQLIVSTTAKSVSSVAIFDLFQSFTKDIEAKTTGVFTQPVVLQSFTPFPGFKGGSVVAAGDFDADGTDDMAIATAHGGSRIRIYKQSSSDGMLADAPDLVTAFSPFGDKFRGGLSLAAGHLSGNAAADLVVGAGTGGGSRVVSFTGDEVLRSSGQRKADTKYRAFGNDKHQVHSPVQVQLVESIVQPEAEPMGGLDANGLTPMFTPSNNKPLARGTIVAYNPQANGLGRISVYSKVGDDTPVNSKLTLPTELKNSKGNYSVNLTSVGYMFDKQVVQNMQTKNYLAPMVLVANAEKSNISLIPLAGDSIRPVEKIFTSNLAEASGAEQFDSPTFPFGLDVKVSLPQAVKVLNSNMTTIVSSGTSGMLPSRQVAFQSPFAFQLSYGNSLFGRYGSAPFTDPLNQTATQSSEWYTDHSTNNYGPPLAAYSSYKTYQPITSTDLKFWQESMVAAGLQLMNRGYSYQHHHFPAWFGPTSDLKYVGSTIAGYPDYSYTPAGMQTPGVDCSDFSNVVVNMVTGSPIKAGVATQATVANGVTDWGGSFEGTSNIYINNDPSQGYLSWQTLAVYFEQHGPLATYQMLNNTLKTGDLLYYGTIPATQIDPATPLTIDKAAHVTIWTGQTLPIPGNSQNIGVPLLMDSHGGNVQTAVDSQNNPQGVVEPNGPQMRAFFVPNSNNINANATYKPLAQFLTTEQLNSQNYYYFTSFTHAIRINFPIPKSSS
ncbi:MAG: hypothetical protein ACKO0V_11935 [bacterium]